MTIRDEVAKAARTAFMADVCPTPLDVVLARVGQWTEAGCWRAEFALKVDDDLTWWGYLVEAGDSWLDAADAWEPAPFDPIAHGWED